MPPGRRREGGFAKDLVIRISFRRGAAAKHFSVTVGIVCGRALLLGFLNPREAWPPAAAAPAAAARAALLWLRGPSSSVVSAGRSLPTAGRSLATAGRSLATAGRSLAARACAALRARAAPALPLGRRSRLRALRPPDAPLLAHPRVIRPHRLSVGVVLDDLLAFDVGLGELEGFLEAAERARGSELLARAPLLPLAMGDRAARLVENPIRGCLLLALLFIFPCMFLSIINIFNRILMIIVVLVLNIIINIVINNINLILVLKMVLRLLLPFSCIIIIIIILIFIMLIILILITILVAWLQGLTSGPSTSTGAEWPSIADRGTKPRGRTAGRSLATRVEASRGGVENLLEGA